MSRSRLPASARALRPKLTHRFPLGLAAGVASTLSCVAPLGQGEIGTPRIAGIVRGAAPLAAAPPVSDRDGNVYLLTGTDTPLNVQVFVGQRGGGFSSGCRLTKGDRFGAHGWVGFDQSRSFYWSGLQLVSVTGFSGDCHRVLDRDPVTGSELQFRAVFPWVNDNFTMTTIVALVQSPGDVTPFTVTIDLGAEVYVAPRGFEPAGARNVLVHGTGASAKLRQGFVYLSYEFGEGRVYEGRFYGEDGTLQKHVSLPDPGNAEGVPFDEYVVRGFLEANDDGLVAGLLADGRMVLFDERGGRLANGPGFPMVGVHRWDGKLYAVGAGDDGTPLVAPIGNDGNVGGATRWAASADAAGAIARQNDVLDDRSPPRREARFEAPRNALGPAPFVTPFSSHPYAKDESLVLVAGPTFGEGTDTFTQVAIAPAGISYP